MGDKCELSHHTGLSDQCCKDILSTALPLLLSNQYNVTFFTPLNILLPHDYFIHESDL